MIEIVELEYLIYEVGDRPVYLKPYLSKVLCNFCKPENNREESKKNPIIMLDTLYRTRDIKFANRTKMEKRVFAFMTLL